MCLFFLFRILNENECSVKFISIVIDETFCVLQLSGFEIGTCEFFQSRGVVPAWAAGA